MVEMTLGEIRSLISKFNDIFFRLRKWEAAAVFFKVYGGEDPEEFRPAYDYERIQKEMTEVNGIIRHFKSMVAYIKSNGYFDNNMSIDEMTMLKEDLEEKVRRLKRILNDISENDTPSDGRSEEDCRNYDSNAIRMDYENAKKELEDISDYLDDSSKYTVFRLEDEDEVDWEKIIRERMRISTSPSTRSSGRISGTVSTTISMGFRCLCPPIILWRWLSLQARIHGDS